MKIAIFSDSPTTVTGQGRVVRALGEQWALQGHEIVSFSWVTGAPNLLPASWRVFSTGICYGAINNNNLAKENLTKAISIEDPDLVLCLGDPFHFEGLQDIIFSLESPRPKFHGYLNVDGRLPHSMYSVVSAFDSVSCTSTLGAKIFKELVGKEFPVAHHGVDLNTFKPVKLKETEPVEVDTMFPGISSWDDIFVVSYVGRNIPRKSIPKLFEAAALAKDSCEGLRLLLLTDPTGLPDAASFYGVLDLTGFIFSSPLEPMSDEFLNKVYNRSDMVVSVSSGEGFCLPLLEALAAGSTVAGPSYTGCGDLAEQGYLIPSETSFLSPENVELHLPDYRALAKAIKAEYGLWANSRETRSPSPFAQARSWKIQAARLLDQATKESFPSYEGTRLPNSTHLPRLASLVAGSVKNTKDSILVTKMGGIGDQIQATPVFKGIRKLNPDRKIVALVEKDFGVFENNPNVDQVVEIGSNPANSIAQTLRPPFCSKLYDLRYVSRVFSEDGQNTEEWQWFYDKWALSNNTVKALGMNVVDLMLKSVGLDSHASVKDMWVHTEPIDVPIGKYIFIHNAGGTLSNLKVWSPKDFLEVTDYLLRAGFVLVQAGLPEEPLINSKAIDFRGKLNLHQTAYLLSQAGLYLGIEGGYFHMAKAVGTEAAVLFSATPPTCFAYDDTIVLHNPICNPCWWRDTKWANECPIDLEMCINFPSSKEVCKILGNLLGIQ